MSILDGTTPGPWWFDGEEYIWSKHNLDGSVEGMVAEMRGVATPQDAHLIAAAPDLAAALEKCKNAMLDAIDNTEEDACPICVTVGGHEEGCGYAEAIAAAESALKGEKG